jgi:hypothetical protein
VTPGGEGPLSDEELLNMFSTPAEQPTPEIDEAGATTTPLPVEEGEQRIQPTARELTGVGLLAGLKSEQLTPGGGGDTEEEKALKAQGVVTDEGAGFRERAYIGLTTSLEPGKRNRVLAEVFKTSVRKKDGELQRLIERPDGTKRWALVNEQGLTAEDITEFVAGEVIPFVGGTTLGLAGATGGSIVGPAGTLAGAAAGEAAGTYLGHVSNLMLVKFNKGLSDDILSIDDIIGLDGGPAQEALIAAVGVVGISALVSGVRSTYRLATGTNISDAVVERLRGALTKRDEVQNDLLKGVKAATDEDLRLTIGQASGDDLALSLEAEARRSALIQGGLSKYNRDPFDEVENSNAMVRAVDGFIQRKYGQGPSQQTTGDVENLIRQKIKDDHKTLQDGIITTRQQVEADFQTAMDGKRATAPNSVEFANIVRGNIQTVRDSADGVFQDKYSELTKVYGKLKGPNNAIAAYKAELKKDQGLVLEKFLTRSWDKLLKEGSEKTAPGGVQILDEFGQPFNKNTTQDLARRASSAGAELSYEEVNTTLKLIRSTLREIKDHGKSADSPDVRILKGLQNAYAKQREEIAALAADGGKMLKDVDDAYRVTKSEVDAKEINAIMEQVNGDFKLGGQQLANFILTPEKIRLESGSDDVISKLLPIIREEPGLKISLDKAIKGAYARAVKLPTGGTGRAGTLALGRSQRSAEGARQAHEEFMDEFGGAFKDLYGEVPATFDDAVKLLDGIDVQNEKLAAALEEMGIDPLLQGGTVGRIKKIIAEGDTSDKARLDEFMEENPVLQDMYVNNYMKSIVEGGERGFPGVIRRNQDGSSELNIDNLRKTVGAIDLGASSNLVDPVAAKYMRPEHRQVLRDILEIAELSNRGLDVGDTVKYKKSKVAHAVQLYLGPLTKGTRFSNTADVYAQQAASRALVNAMKDPESLRRLLDKYDSPSDFQLAVTRHLYGMGAQSQVGSFNENEAFVEPTAVDLPLQEALRVKREAEALAEEGEGGKTSQGASQEPTEAPTGASPAPISANTLPEPAPVATNTTGSASSAQAPGDFSREDVLTEIRRRAQSPEGFQ